MNELILKRGESLKVIGEERKSFVVLTNLDGDIFNRTDWNREESNQSSQTKPSVPPLVGNSDGGRPNALVDSGKTGDTLESQTKDALSEGLLM